MLYYLMRNILLKDAFNPEEELSAGQIEEIDRLYKNYPHLGFN